MWPYSQDLAHAEIEGTIHNWRYQYIELLNEQLTKVCDWRHHNLVIEIAYCQKLTFNLSIVSFVLKVNQYMVT